MSKTTSAEILKDLQGLRGIAVMLVVLYHAAIPGVSGGYVGVDIFFAISGYLITGLLFQERLRTGTIDFAEFYARRARRLLPAASVTIAATLVWSWFMNSPVEQRGIASSAFAATFYFSNVWFALGSNDYFGGGSENNPLLHTWSLAVEEQFYFLWPALVFLAARGVSREQVRSRLVLVLVIASGISLTTCVYLTWTNQPWAFYLMPTRIWEFGLGALCILLLPRGSQLRPFLSVMMTSVGALLIVWAATQFDEHSRFPGFVALVPAVGAGLLLGAGRATRPGFVSRILSTSPMCWLGDVSYSWYLWHWPVLVATKEFIGRGQWTIWMAIAGSLVLATASYRLVENPIRRSPALTRRVWASLASGALVALMGGTIALVAHRGAATAMTSPRQKAYSDAKEDGPPTGACHATFAQVDLPDCAFGAVRSPRTIVLFGDSHAHHWFPAVEYLAGKVDARLVSLTKSACPSVDVTVYHEGWKRPYYECDTWRAAMISRIVAMRPALVVISNAEHQQPAASGGPAPLTPDEWGRGVDKLLSRLNVEAIPVLVIHDTPFPYIDVPACLARAAWHGASGPAACAFLLAPETTRRIKEAEDKSVGHQPDAFAMDFTKVICPREPCETERDGYVLYRDDSHLTARFSRSLGETLLQGVKDYATRRPVSRVSELFMTSASPKTAGSLAHKMSYP